MSTERRRRAPSFGRFSLRLAPGYPTLGEPSGAADSGFVAIRVGRFGADRPIASAPARLSELAADAVAAGTRAGCADPARPMAARMMSARPMAAGAMASALADGADGADLMDRYLCQLVVVDEQQLVRSDLGDEAFELLCPAEVDLDELQSERT